MMFRPSSLVWHKNMLCSACLSAGCSSLPAIQAGGGLRTCQALQSLRSWQPHFSGASQTSGDARRQHTRHIAFAAAAVAAPAAEPGVAYEAVIGIECHVQLNTHTKAFCGCSTSKAPINVNVCPICLAHPGTLPVLNEGVLRKAITAGLALGCDVARRSKFDRKQYFYPDLPKGYQISQYDVPICAGGALDAVLPDGQIKRVGITRAHIEEDAGKLVHSGADQLSGSDYSLVDYNRSGVPLLEVVSEPDMASGAEAVAYAGELRRMMLFMGLTEGVMADGHLRFDVNVSVREQGNSRLGTKVEVKNMNSFSAMQRAIDFEINRQVGLHKSGRAEDIVQETRLFDETKLETFSMRTKEGLADYRYFPEPDLPPLHVTQELIDSVRESMPEAPAAVRERYAQLGLPPADVITLAEEVSVSRYFDAALAEGATAKQAANWVMGDLMAHCKENRCTFDDLALAPADLAELLGAMDEGIISGKIGKQVLPELLQGKGQGGIRAYLEENGLAQISDVGALEVMVDEVLAANPKQLEQFCGGKTKLQGFFAGQVMKASKGLANPGLLNDVLLKKLDDARGAVVR